MRGGPLGAVGPAGGKANMGSGTCGVNDRVESAMERTGLEPVTPCLQSGIGLLTGVSARLFPLSP